MLARIRAFAKSWVAVVLLGLLIVSFAIFGITDVFQPTRGNWVVQAGSRTVSATEFKSVFDNYREQRPAGGTPDPGDAAVEQGLPPAS
jgi:peptidyl-prolyl cis-trans isomerase D